MINKVSRNTRRSFKHKRIRKKIYGTNDIPRVSVYKSTKNIYAQVIDDDNKQTILNISSLSPAVVKKFKNVDKEMTKKVGVSKLVGTQLSELVKEKGIKKVRFDRGGYSYHGRIKALADGLREGGIEF
ncbi:MAG: 50S ribosomal protein L18 [Thermodesulfobacteriota bacterium]